MPSPMSQLRRTRHATPGCLTAAMALLLVIAWPWPVCAQAVSSGDRIVIEGAKTEKWETPLDSATGLAIPCTQVRSRLLVEGAASSWSGLVHDIPHSFPDLNPRIRVEHSATAFRQDMSDSAEVIEGTAGVVPRVVIRDAGATMLVADLSVERGPAPATVEGRLLVEHAAVSGIQAMALPVRTPPPAPAAPSEPPPLPTATTVTEPAQPATPEQNAPSEPPSPAVPVPQPEQAKGPLWPWLLLGAAIVAGVAIGVVLIVRHHRKGLRHQLHGDTTQNDPRG
jgi:hypothetical protein